MGAVVVCRRAGVTVRVAGMFSMILFTVIAGGLCIWGAGVEARPRMVAAKQCVDRGGVPSEYGGVLRCAAPLDPQGGGK
jgi:hypothetical protein